MIADAVAALPNQRTIRPAIKMPLAGTPAALSRFDMRYARDMIRSFRCKDTGRLAAGHRVRRFVAIERVAQRKLAQLDAAATLDFLRAPPGNRLEALKGDRSAPTAFGSTISGGCASALRTETLMTQRLLTITEGVMP